MKNDDVINEAYRSDNIWSFHNLVTHDNSSSEDDAPGLMMQALTCLFLLRCLQFNGYIKPTDEKMKSLNEEEMFFAKLLHHLMRAAYYNTHEVKRFFSYHKLKVYDPGFFDGFKRGFLSISS